MTRMEALYRVLDRLKELHRELHRLALEKKEALIHNDIDALVRITQQEHKWIKTVQETEAERAEIVRAVLAERGIPLAEATLLDLIKSVPQPQEKLRLQQHRDELLGIVSQLRQANQLNQQLLEQSLSFVRMTLNALTDAPENDYIYKKPSGYPQQTHAIRSFINHKA